MRALPAETTPCFLHSKVPSESRATLQSILRFLVDESDEKIADVNFIGIMKCTRVALLHMAKRGGGVIVNTASVVGLRGNL